MGEELKALLTRLRALSSPEDGDEGETEPERSNPPLPTAPRSFQDTLSAILGQDVNVQSLPSLAGRSGLATPVLPNTILTEPEFAGDDPASRFTQGHELGHLLDFKDAIPGEADIKSRLGGGNLEDHVAHAGLRSLQQMLGIVREDPRISEQFADEFEGALSSFQRGEEPQTRTEAQLHRFIRSRLAEFDNRRAKRMQMARDATAIGGR